ncbi:ATP-binding protein [Pirellulaceae bacterium SH449]
MIAQNLQTRFLLAGSLLVAATIGSSLWSGLAFRRMNLVVNATLRESQEIVDLSAELHSSLEREDDALLLFLSGADQRARENLETERNRGDASYARLLTRLQGSDQEEQRLASELYEEIKAYRAAGDELLSRQSSLDGLETYHRRINPLLRRAVSACELLREANFRSMQQAGVQARDESGHGIRLVAIVSVLTVLLGIGVAVWLARSVLGPVRALTRSVDEVRRGNYDLRVDHFGKNELGQLASGFNRMAEALAEYRRSSLGDLLAAKTTLEATLNALPDAVFVFAPDESIVAMNPPAKKILRAKRVESSKSLSELPFSDDQKSIVRAALTGTIVPERGFDFSQTLNFEWDGRLRRFTLTAVAIPNFQHDKYGAVAVLDDVTEFAKLDEVRSELIGVASHELNSPLTSLRMSLLMLAEEIPQLSPRLQQLLDASVAGCQELGLTIEELLDVTRVEAGQLRLNLALIDLRVLIDSAVSSLRTRLDDASIRLQREEEPGLPNPLNIWGDQVRLSRVLANVLENAIKYSPESGVVTIEIKAAPIQKSYSSLIANTSTEPRRGIEVIISDQGPGVPAEYEKRIFEKFFRVENQQESQDRKIRGTGIGLYLCREIMLAHGGEIYCDQPESGRGARFAIRLAVP